MPNQRVLIDSRNREKDASEQQNRFNYTYKLYKQVSRVYGMRLLHANIPKLYNVSAFNNTFYFSEDSGGGHVAFPITLDPSWYTASQLAVHLGEKMSQASSGGTLYSGSWNANTNKISITSASGATNDPYKISFFANQTSETARRCATLTGGNFDTDPPEDTVPSSRSLDFQVDLRSPRYFNLRITLGSGGNSSSLSQSNNFQFTYYIPAESDSLYSVAQFSQGNEFPQGDSLTNIPVDQIKVEIFPEDNTTYQIDTDLEHEILLEILSK